MGPVRFSTQLTQNYSNESSVAASEEDDDDREGQSGSTLRQETPPTARAPAPRTEARIDERGESREWDGCSPDASMAMVLAMEAAHVEDDVDENERAARERVPQAGGAIRAAVLHAFEAGADAELSMQPGDQLLLEWQTPTGWAFAHCRDRSGFIPSNRIQIAGSLPPGWEMRQSEEDAPFYVDTVNGTSQWHDPRLVCREDEARYSATYPCSTPPSVISPRMHDIHEDVITEGGSSPRSTDASTVLSRDSFTTIDEVNSQVRRAGEIGGGLHAQLLDKKRGSGEHLSLTTLLGVQQQEAIEQAAVPFAMDTQVLDIRDSDDAGRTGGSEPEASMRVPPAVRMNAIESARCVAPNGLVLHDPLLSSALPQHASGTVCSATLPTPPAMCALPSESTAPVDSRLRATAPVFTPALRSRSRRLSLRLAYLAGALLPRQLHAGQPRARACLDQLMGLAM